MLPTPPAPTITPPTDASSDPEDDEKYDGPDGGIEGKRDEARPKMNVEPREHPVTNKCSDNSYHQVADNSESATIDNFARQPSGDNPNDDYRDEAFICHRHNRFLPISPLAPQMRVVSGDAPIVPIYLAFCAFLGTAQKDTVSVNTYDGFQSSSTAVVLSP
jgi:hypothetical protein